MSISDLNPLGNGNSNGTTLADLLPKTALQAIYHDITGKTENLSKRLSGDKLINLSNIDHLYAMIIEQIGQYDVMFGPTVTIVLKNINDKSITYSSWERFKNLMISNHDITSEIAIKFEFVIQNPQTSITQRCIINVGLDSSLPIIHEQRAESKPESEHFGLIFFFRQKWPVVHISIDFVDFLVARVFMGIIEEWFNTLNNTPLQKLNSFMFRRMELIRLIFSQFGRIGIASFLLAFVIYKDNLINLNNLTISLTIGLIVWAIFNILQSYVLNSVAKRLSSNVIPAVILLSEKDNSCYREILNSINSAKTTAYAILATLVFGIFVNVLSSYLYAYLST